MTLVFPSTTTVTSWLNVRRVDLSSMASCLCPCGELVWRASFSRRVFCRLFLHVQFICASGALEKYDDDDDYYYYYYYYWTVVLILGKLKDYLALVVTAHLYDHRHCCVDYEHDYDNSRQRASWLQQQQQQ